MIELAVSGILQGVFSGLLIAFITLGMTLIYRVSRIANFAHGSFLLLSMYGALVLNREFQLNSTYFALLLGPAMWLLGLLVYLALIRPIRKYHHLLVVQLLLGLAFIISAGLLIIFGGDVQAVQSPLSSEYIDLAGTGFAASTLLSAVISLIGIGFLVILVRWSEFGRHLRAIASDDLAARLAGIPVERIEALTWALGIGTLGVISPIAGSIIPLSPDIGLHYTVLALVVLILGGMSSLVGTIYAALLIGIAQALGLLFLPHAFGDLMPYALLVLVLVVHPGGLMNLIGRR